MATITPSPLLARPEPDEHLPYYARYVELVPDGDVVDRLERQLEETLTLVSAFGEQRAGHRYAPGKWSVREVVGHVVDTERIFTYRALAAARGETTPLPGFDENAYVAAADFDARTLNSLLGELTVVRRATLTFFRNLGDPALLRRVSANGAPITPRAIAWIVAGHERHHRNILRERYGGAA
jgi:uncharacterized damage-inducible protein DinB